MNFEEARRNPEKKNENHVRTKSAFPGSPKCDQDIRTESDIGQFFSKICSVQFGPASGFLTYAPGSL